MIVLDPPIIRFYQWVSTVRKPIRADRSGNGILPIRAVRYCEALTSATAFGWWLFPPIDLEMLWDGSDIFWRRHEETQWLPLQSSAQLPGYVEEFDGTAPQSMKGCSPPFLTALPEPGTVQLWTGLVVQTAPGWHLLVRAPVNIAQTGGICLFEGIVQTDHWFGPLFTNMRFTRSHIPVRLCGDKPLLQVQPLRQDAYNDGILDRVEFKGGLSSMTLEDWNAYNSSIVEPNSRPDRSMGEYATRIRKRGRAEAPSTCRRSNSDRRDGLSGGHRQA